MSNFTRIVKTQVKFGKFHAQDVILWSLTFIFLGSHKKFSLVLGWTHWSLYHVQVFTYLPFPCSCLQKSLCFYCINYTQSIKLIVLCKCFIWMNFSTNFTVEVRATKTSTVVMVTGCFDTKLFWCKFIQLSCK